jgi:hypothetical protein
MRKISGRLGSVLESRNAAATGIAMTLPFGILFFGAVNNIPPFDGRLDPYLASGGFITDLLVVILGASLLLLPVALVLNVLAIIKRRKGKTDVTGLTFNVSLSISLFLIIAMIIIDYLTGH